MCTAISLQSKQNEVFFGRTMDFSYEIDPGLYYVPRNNRWLDLASSNTFYDKYSFISIGQESDGLLSFFDGVNEHGFAAAVLYFADYAYYDLTPSNTEPIANLDFLHFILGNCTRVDDLDSLLENIRIVGVSDPVTNTVTPLHWMATDHSGKSVVIEQTKNGLKIIYNPIGVMANSPDINWHLTNLRNYMTTSVIQDEKAQWSDLSLTPFGQGGGTMPLPGGYTSPERFVRCSFLKSHVEIPTNRYDMVKTCFHIMNSVTIPKGIVVTSKGTDDYTKYIAFVNTNTCEYFFKTYDNNQIIRACLWDYYSYNGKPVFLGSLSHPAFFENFS